MSVKHVFRKVFLLSGIFFTLFIRLSGQKRITFQSIQEGLSNYHIKCIFEDSKGFMWFGTYDGLNKYDGNTFVVYENIPTDSSSLINSFVNAMVEDQNHNIWIGTANGISRYNRIYDNFSNIPELKKFDFLSINDLFIDPANNLWIATSGNGLIRFNLNNHEVENFKHEKDNTNSVCSNFVTSIVTDSKGRMWLGTRNGLNVFYPSSKKFELYTANEKSPSSLSNNHILALTIDKSNQLWIGTYGGGVNKLIENNGCISFQNLSKTFIFKDFNNNILSLCCDKNNAIWIGTENGGLLYFDNQNNTIQRYTANDQNQNSLLSNSIWAIYENKQGIIWVGTYNKGINTINENYNKLELFQRNNQENSDLVNNDIKFFAKDKNGIIWMATDGGGICGFNPISRGFIPFKGNKSLSTKSVISLCIDNKGNFWAGTWSFGIDKFNRSGNKIRNYKCSTKPNFAGNITSIVQDSRENIFAGTSGNGLFMYNKITDSFNPVIYDTTNSHLNDRCYISVILEDSFGYLWIGTSYGLVQCSYNEKNTFTFKQYTTNKASGLTSSNIKSIYEDANHQLWIGTDNGLQLFDRKTQTFTDFNIQNGLPNNNINSITSDTKSNLWLGTNKGLAKFSVSKGLLRQFTVEDGLGANELTSGACIKSDNGNLLFGGSNGFNMFNPENIKFNTEIPKVYITKFRITNSINSLPGKRKLFTENITELKRISLKYNQNSFSIDFVAINFTRSAKNQYKYKLEGFDKNWINAGNSNTVTYTNLDAGTYNFMVIGSNNDGVWNTHPVKLQIQILPPFWRSIWAYLIYILIFTILLIVFLKLWMLKTEQSHRLKYERMQWEQAEELNQLKIQFFTNVSHELRTPLTLIISPLQHILATSAVTGKLKQHLTLIYKNSERLFQLVNELLDFSKFEENKLKLFPKQADIIQLTRENYYLFTDEARLKNIQYTFETETENFSLTIDSNKLEKVFVNLLSNAFKFVPQNGYIKIKCEIPEPGTHFNLKFINSGSGIQPEYLTKIFERFYQIPGNQTNNFSGTGIGLALVKSIVELHNGTITVSSILNQETCFTISLPINNLSQITFETQEIKNISNELTSNVVKKTIKSKEKSAGISEILVVEDNVELRKFLVTALSDEFTVSEAVDGEMGLEKALQTLPDLIISDILMPKISGLELCKMIKENIAVSHIPVILLTAKNTIENHIEGVEFGADLYLTKPFNVTYLKVSVKNLVNTRKKIFQKFSKDIYLIPREISTNKSDQKFLEQSISFIKDNIGSYEISVERLADFLTMNRSNVYRKIKALTGESVTDFIKTIRLKMALQYLETGDYSISEISYKVGFSSPAYFTKCFREHFGKLPSEVIKN